MSYMNRADKRFNKMLLDSIIATNFKYGDLGKRLFRCEPFSAPGEGTFNDYGDGNVLGIFYGALRKPDEERIAKADALVTLLADADIKARRIHYGAGNPGGYVEVDFDQPDFSQKLEKLSAALGANKNEAAWAR